MTKAKINKWLTCVAVVALLAGLLIGCAAPGAKETGELVISLRDDMAAKTLLPTNSWDNSLFDMAADSYKIDGLGTFGRATGEVFHLTATVANPNVAVEVLPGTWHVLVTVFNKAIPENPPAPAVPPEAIGKGEDDIVVMIEQTSNRTIHCAAFGGSDASTSFMVGLYWTTGILTEPSAECELIPFSGPADAFQIPLTVDYQSATSGWSHPNAGWYVALARIYDQGVLDLGLAEVARVAFAHTTKWYVIGLDVAQLHGQMIVDFDYAECPPLQLTTTPAPGSVPLSPKETKILTVTGADFDGGLGGIYSWYRNGLLIEASEENHLDVVASSLYLDRLYNYSAIVWQADGSRAGAAQWGLKVTP